MDLATIKKRATKEKRDTVKKKSLTHIACLHLIEPSRIYIYILKIPTTFNWCDKTGFCTPVKSQGYSCGSCWAFTSASAIETNWAIRKGKLFNLSQQFFVDCSKTFPNSGCGGGNCGNAFYDSRLIPLYDEYPYTGTDDECKESKISSKSEVHLFGGYEYIVRNFLL